MLGLLRRRPTRRDPAPVRAGRIRDRLDVLEMQRLELLADEGVPGRKHRLDAIAGAQRDLRAELDALPAA